MIDSRELMIGSMVRTADLPEGQFITVSKIDDYFINGDPELRYRDLEGIILTEKILMHFLFSALHLSSEAVPPYTEGWFVFPQELTGAKLCIDKEGHFYCYMHYAQVGRKFNFVHQLQRLYTGLTGKHLVYHAPILSTNKS
jgi:hypothetical protein